MLLRDLPRGVEGDGVCDLAWLSQLAQVLQMNVVQTQVLVLRDVLVKARFGFVHQHAQRVAVGVRFALQGFSDCPQVRQRQVRADFDALQRLYEHLEGLIGHPHDLFDRRERTDVVQVLAGWIVIVLIALRQQQHATIRRLRFLDAAAAFDAPDRDALRVTGGDDHVAKC